MSYLIIIKTLIDCSGKYKEGTNKGLTLLSFTAERTEKKMGSEY